MSGAFSHPGPAGPPGTTYARPRPNPGRTAAVVIAWVSVVLVPVAGFVAMVIDREAGWLMLTYVAGVGPLQALAHLTLAIMLGAARSAAPQRPVSPWIPVAYAVYVPTFLAAAYLILDFGDTPVSHTPWRESAEIAVLPLLVVSAAAFLALVVLVVLDLIRARKTRAMTQSRAQAWCPPRQPAPPGGPGDAPATGRAPHLPPGASHPRTPAPMV